ncbi:MAG: TetR family transcriptional regulator [Candidatus Binataceae bacterium]|nr:TetR family transcriptional regulator [Candidatus Binataceae bacterium]
MRAHDLETTRKKILRAALAEFSANGPQGARTAAIARRAGVNKRMLFYCFGSKAGLYREVLRHKLAQRASIMESTPEDLGSALVHWFDNAARDPVWIRLLHWEALATGGGTVAAEERRKLFDQALAIFRRWIERGSLEKEVDPAQWMISMLGLTIFPLAFPHIVRLATGLASDDAAFKAERHEFLRWIAGRIGGGAITANAVAGESEAGTAHASAARVDGANP